MLRTEAPVLGTIYVTRPIFPEAIDFLKRQAAVEVNSEDRVLSKRELIERLRNAQGAVTLLTDIIDADVLGAAQHLRVVSNVAVGFNNVDLKAAGQFGVLITNTPGVLTDTTADFAWALLMAAARRVAEADAFTRAGHFKAWGLQMFLGHDVHGKTLGILGYGRIGRAVARRAKGFGMTIQYYDPQLPVQEVDAETGARPVNFESLLKTSDFISIHVPLLPETQHLLDDKAFALMKDNCIVVNTSRGPVVDEKALVRALRDRRIAAAGLDVYEREPEIEPELLTFNNVVLAPHIASASRETRLRMCMMAAENALAALRGDRPPNLVNEEVWDKRRR